MCDCIDCEYVGFEPPCLVCTFDNRKEVIIDGDLALKHLYKECPLKKRKGYENI